MEAKDTIVFDAILDNSGVVAGNIIGSNVTGSQTINHYYPAKPETPPTPTCTLPFPRDRDFVNRETIFEKIREACDAPASRTALVGLGGVGKSQIAIEYCYRTAEASPSNTWIFWVHCSNATRFEQGFREIANRVKIPARNDPNANVWDLVHDWLRDCEQKWLLVLDNVDDAAFLQDFRIESQLSATDKKNGLRSLRDYLPSCDHGSILITSRNIGVTVELVEEYNTITVEPMGEEQALALFQSKLRVPKKDSKSPISELIAALEYMPLAIVQAAAYISRRGPRCSIAQYLENFLRSDLDKTSLLNYEAGQLRRDAQAKNSIISTWQISFEHLLQTRSSAADLLSLMSFFDREGIPTSLLQNYSLSAPNADTMDVHQVSNQYDRSEYMFEDDITALCDFHFISILDDGTTFEMHRLIQLATQTWLKANCKLDKWQQSSVEVLCAAFPTRPHDDLNECKNLFAHVKRSAEQMPKGGAALVAWCTLLYRAGVFQTVSYNISDALHLCYKSKDVREKVLGAEHESTLQCASQIGELISKSEDKKDREIAESFLKQVLKTCLGSLGLHLVTLRTMDRLALFYLDEERNKEAQELYSKLLELDSLRVDADPLESAEFLSGMGTIYQAQGHYEESEKLHLQALKIYEERQKSDHIYTFHELFHLGETYSSQKRYKEAESHFSRAAKGYEKTLGRDHDITRRSLQNLLEVYIYQRAWEEFRELHAYLVSLLETKHGAHCQATADMNYCIAHTLLSQCQYTEAEELLLRAQAGLRKDAASGSDHRFNLFMSTYQLGFAYVQLRRDDEAEATLLETVQGLDNLCDAPIRTDVVFSHLRMAMRLLATFYEARERSEEAEGWWERVDEVELEMAMQESLKI